MARSLQITAAVVAVAVLPAIAMGYQLHTHPNNVCRFQGNGTCFDLSDVFDWPAVITAPSKLYPGYTYTYHFDPCSPLPKESDACAGHAAKLPGNATTTRGDEPGIAMCQTWPASDDPDLTLYAMGGLLEPYATWNGIFPGEKNSDGEPARMDIQLGYGDAWRNVVLTVEETDDANHTVSFMGEAPVMQYNFLLRGKGAFGRVNTYPCLSA